MSKGTPIKDPFDPERSTVPAKIRARNQLIRDAEALYGHEPDEADREILNTDPATLVDRLKRGEGGFTCQRVMQAYIRAACAVQRTHNCLTEVMFQEAMAEAKRKDAERESGAACEGPFWGLPSSFKDTFNVVGVDTSLGCSPHCDKPTKDPRDEGELVKLFRLGGGIPFCKTNIPQTLLAFECSNPVFGPALHPTDPARAPGGSSGGEAALVALKATPVGWGSDIGGSLRIPAHYSGICGLKPVKGRWPSAMGRKPIPGFEAVRVSVGPMARNVSDLTWAAKVITDLTTQSGNRGEESLVPVPWREVTLPKVLRVGWFTEFGGVKTSPACARAVKVVVDSMKAAGHQVEEFHPPEPVQALKIFAALTSSDGYQTLLSNIGSDPMEPSMRLVTLGPKIPSLIKALAVWAIKTVVGDETFASAFETSKRKDVRQFWEWTDRRDVWAETFNRMAWAENKYDMIVCPVQATPALKHGETEFLSPLSLSTIMYNICDSTVGVLPVVRVDKEQDAVSSASGTNESGSKDLPRSKLLEKRVYHPETGVYDEQAMHGLPVGVQIVGRAYEEEKVLAMMKIVEELVKYE
ncbi:amidase signature domain-containing protein [Papiliotrema laurentii]|uniref:amidase n=1 Tax=Papiliotrema laurentii TaxID=5418 RepID=A0AAD9L6M2_PAPLA|nr:amidase signature domain-containing protein [Papiliotrema laurentii]